jgi:hypothetical protein
MSALKDFHCGRKEWSSPRGVLRRAKITRSKKATMVKLLRCAEEIIAIAVASPTARGNFH